MTKTQYSICLSNAEFKIKDLQDKIAELEKELESALYFNIDVVRCLSRLAWEHNHNERQEYMELSKKCIETIESKKYLKS